MGPAIGAYVKWLKEKQPYFYKILVKKYPQASQLSGMGLVGPENSGVTVTEERTNSSVTASWADTIKNLIGVASQAYLTKEQIDAQKKLTQMQLDRVAQGLSPLNIDPTTMGLPGPSVNFGLTGDTKKLVTWGAVGLGLLFAFHTLFGRKSRA